jgi:hypothetical protein
LIGGLRAGVVGRRGEVRHQPFQLRVRRRRQSRHDLRRRGARAQAAHPGIDLEVVAHRLSGRRGQPVQIAHLRERMHRRREIVLDQRRLFKRQKPAHHQNPRRSHAGRAQRRAFIHRAHRQPARAFADQHARDLDGAVAVSIGLHHAQNFHARPNHRADVAIIARDLLARRHQHERTKWNRHYSHSNGHRGARRFVCAEELGVNLVHGAKSLPSARNTEHFTTSAMVAPQPSRIRPMLVNTRRVSCWISPSSTLSVAGSTGTCPDTKMKSPARTAGE